MIGVRNHGPHVGREVGSAVLGGNAAEVSEVAEAALRGEPVRGAAAIEFVEYFATGRSHADHRVEALVCSRCGFLAVESLKLPVERVHDVPRSHRPVEVRVLLCLTNQRHKPVSIALPHYPLGRFRAARITCHAERDVGHIALPRTLFPDFPDVVARDPEQLLQQRVFGRDSTGRFGRERIGPGVDAGVRHPLHVRDGRAADGAKLERIACACFHRSGPVLSRELCLALQGLLRPLAERFRNRRDGAQEAKSGCACAESSAQWVTGLSCSAHHVGTVLGVDQIVGAGEVEQTEGAASPAGTQ